MRLFYLYVADGQASTDERVTWNPNKESENIWISDVGLNTEGPFYMLKQLYFRKIIDELIVVIESTKSPGVKEINGVKYYVVPKIDLIKEYVQPGDIFYVRGGWRSWYNFLVEMSKDHWMINYAANTGRQKWTFWDIVLNDLEGKTYMDGVGRLQLQYCKPIHPGIFKPKVMPKKYDICIGASHITDKKGQWRVISALSELKKQGITLNCIMPGRIVGKSIHTTKMKRVISEENLSVQMPGMISRKELADVFCQSTLYVHCGTSGQNDRGPIEALSCGCPILLGYPKYHMPELASAPCTIVSGSGINKSAFNVKELANEMYNWLRVYENNPKARVMQSGHYDKNCGELVHLSELAVMLEKLCVKKNDVDRVVYLEELFCEE